METIEKKVIPDKELRNKVRFITFIIPEFARAYKMDKQEAYLYLKKYGGLDYLFEHWWALHTDNPFWTIRSLYKICYRNGGPR
ncbi:MAG: DUF3791 domain-containing protein [Dysgonamonadaceae bacterium]|jgi:hypothetical protein|nr:DUF3791 domain-containing protein [Dysgonamonadaceae bacterium]